MTQQTIEKLTTNISRLQKEVNLLRSFVIGEISKDKEGEYNPEFIKRILQASRRKANFEFKDKKTFLAKLRRE
ncbi:MAG: hypothetical protein A3H02_01985 [Candidatus Niyogibacteria bacterium RIFCSPLOWO2_12_FULL_41_13]|uniref:Uncharacterized protein n=1 Tax=Candidatus Niyogibacteria bacterium RIFCSPLOWO2_12_FULL_41_13 TaxID=1801726 RepID=A0A1G2F211_9BACT|nr:MAG: hypothetical protein A3H02_01985 [Candidatus Niyogibacteria bacterium RIFCSPLOWO2_12_FULL_41_13]